MKKVLSNFFILVLLFQYTNAQKLELGKVTKAELEEKYHPIDSTASAAILFKTAKTVFKYNLKDGFVSSTEFNVKIKIYKKEGLNWANFEIPYYVGYKTLNDEQISISKAYTYNLENGKIQKDKVTSEGKFKEKVNELWETKIITFPNVKVGSVIELKYELKSQNLSELPVFQYQYKIPVNYAQYLTEIPEFYIYKAIKIGFIDVTMNDVLEDASTNYTDKYNNPVYFRYKQIKTIYEVAEVPALIEENYVSNINDYYGKIENELQIIRFPGEEPKQIATTWESVAKSIYSEERFGGELKKNDYFMNDLKNITEKIESKEERLKVIFEFVKKKMNWNERFGYYTSKNIETAYKENSGNSAEINLILTAMLRMGGLEASPVLLSTRDNGVALFPNRSKFNYVIASVSLDGKIILLDATNKFATTNTLPTRDLNNKGRLINNDGTSDEIDLMPKYNSVSNLNLIVNLDSNGQIEGKIRKEYADYNALKFRNQFSGMSNESYLEQLEKKYPGLEIENYEVTNKIQIYEPIIESYSIKDANVVEKIGDKMFFSPMLYLAQKENYFKQEDRKYQVDFAFPSTEKHSIVISIPEGYKIESLPKVSNFSIENKYLSFNFSATNQGNQIVVVLNLEYNNSVIPAQYYSSLKEFFKLVIEKQNEKIVLKKV